MTDFDNMTPEEIRAWAEAERAKSSAAFAGKPKPRISQVKRDDYPHWELVDYGFHTRDGKRVLVDRGDHQQVEGTLRGVRPTELDRDALVVELDGQVWACERADGSNWAPGDSGRVRVKTLEVPVLARPFGDPAAEPLPWTLQTNMEGQP